MLYLKPYKLFESSELNHNEIQEDVMGILLPLSDDGLEIVAYFMFHKRLDGIGKLKIFITNKNNKEFNLTPYLYDLTHLNNYLEENGWVLESDPSVSDRNYGFDKWISDLNNSQSYMAVPMFYVTKH